MLSLYALLIWRALRMLAMAKNLFGSLIAGGVVAMLMFQVFVNVGMTIGIMPITGVTLPLMSYGGSSVITTFLAVGLLQSIYVQARASLRSRAACCFTRTMSPSTTRQPRPQGVHEARSRSAAPAAALAVRAGACVPPRMLGAPHRKTGSH